MNEEPRTGWHMKREVPIALITALIIQTAGMVWWASSLTNRMGQVERRITNTESRLDNNIAMGERVARVEAIVERVSNQLDTVERKVDRLSNGRK